MYNLSTASVPDAAYHHTERCGEEELLPLMHECVQRLRALNAVTEGDFLTTGRQLDAILARTRKISERSMQASSLINSDDIRQDMEGLHHSLDTIGNVFMKSQRDMQQGSGSLMRMLGLVTAAGQPLSSFDRTVKHLRILGIATKIESARIQTSDDSFYLLAEDVEKLSHVIVERSNDISQGLSRLQGSIESTLSGITTLQDQEFVKTEKTLERTGSILSELSAIRSRSSKTALMLVDQSKDISRGISGVVASLQFHDITRQQIEHVAATLEEIGFMGLSREVGSDDILSMINHVAGLQIEQLANAKTELSDAVRNIVDELRGVAETVTAMSRETRAMLGVVGDNSSSFLTEIVASLSSIVSFLEESAHRGDETSAALNDVSGTMDELSGFANHINDIGAEIELIALNAQIKAAHAKEGGDALGVIAEAIANLSEGTKRQTAVVTSTLEDIHKAATTVNIGGEKGQTGEEISLLTNEAERLSDSARSANGSVEFLMKDLERESKELIAAINEITGGITAHIKADAVVNTVIAELKRIAIQSRLAAPGGESARVKEYLDGLSRRYTMIQERRIHRSHAGEVDNAGADISDDQLGDNVELF